jgi:eukaryotic-like serine/threonine-protein kinase
MARRTHHVTLAAGTRLGPYEVIAPIGEGGMGEVYRARDARLGRDVAIKVLPAAVSDHPDRLRRFEQEARATSALNHPNVLVVHDIGQFDGSPYVVSELLDGVPLRQLLTGTPMPPSRVASMGVEIARGLAAAHDRGIVHRDIKPENLFVTRDGRVKILDFGVAKILQTGVDADPATKTSHQTESGVVIGTVGYMSPEQVRGEPVDARADIFALGVVLYEMLAGRRPFARGSNVETLSAILTDTPADLSSGDGGVPPALDRIVRHCLEKDPAQRFQSARDVAFALDGAVSASGPSAGGLHVSPRPAARWRWTAAGLSGLAVLTAVAVGAWYARRGQGADAPDVRFEIPAPPNGTLQGILGVSSAISPDGRRLVMAVTTETGPRLFLRDLASTVAVALEGTDGASGPFWSPDSQSIGFFTDTKLKRISVNGGAPQTICDLSPESASNLWKLASWGPDGTILATGIITGATQSSWDVIRVPASGGPPTVALHGNFMWPSFLPDGRHFLVFTGSMDSREIRVGFLDSQETTLVTKAYSRGICTESGHLLFVRDGDLLAQAFDLRTLTLTGSPAVVADNVLYFRDLGQADFSVSRTGVLAYQAGGTSSRLVWYRRDGTDAGQLGDTADYFFLNLSKDGAKVAVDVMDRRSGTTDLRVFDLARGGQSTALTSDPTIDWTPILSPNGEQVAFASARRGAPHVHVKRITDPGRGEEIVASSGQVQFVTDWATTSEGETIVYQDSTPGSGQDVVATIVAGGKRSRRVLVQTRGDDWGGKISPNGQWLAYVSTESGRSEVFVQPLRNSGDRWQVSSSGGVSPRWSHDGRELFYLAAVTRTAFGPTVVDGRLMAVSVSTTGTFRAGVPTPLFTVRARGGQYEPSADGTRFLINVGSGTAALPITVALNWMRALGR